MPLTKQEKHKKREANRRKLWAKQAKPEFPKRERVGKALPVNGIPTKVYVNFENHQQMVERGQRQPLTVVLLERTIEDIATVRKEIFGDKG